MKNLLFVLICSLAITSCSKVTSDVIQSVSAENLTKYKSFEFFDLDVTNKTELTPQMQNIELLKDAIRMEMKNLGYEETDNADLKVNIGIVMEEKVTTRQTDLSDAPPYIGQRNYHWESEEIVVGTYEKGTALVDLVDSNANELVWEGMISGVIVENQSKMKKRIVDGVMHLFAKFPK
jgi:hypothetical protein